MRNFKRILAIAAGIAIIMIVNAALSYALCPYTTAKYEISRIEQGGYEQLVVGTSHGKCGIDPEVLTEQTGLETFNLCRGGEYPVDVLYLVKEAASKNDLKRVIYEVDPAYWEVKANQIADYVIYYREFPFSVNKVQYFCDKMLNVDYRTGLTSWYLYRNNLKQIPEIISVKQTEGYKNCELIDSFQSEGQNFTDRGFIAINHLDSDKATEDVPTLWTEEGARDDSLKAVDKLVSYCNAQGIELVFVMTPIPDLTLSKYQSNYDAASAFLTSYAGERNVKLINYWEDDSKSAFRNPDCFHDYDGHMYKESAAEFTADLAKSL